MSTRNKLKKSSRFFASDSATPPPTRRITRASLAKFAYGADAETKAAIKSTLEEEEGDSGDLRLGSDIEDAITRTSRKRRRVTTRNGDTTSVKLETTTTTTLASSQSPESSVPKAPRRARKPARKTQDPETGETTVSPPSDWEQMYDAVVKMRQPGGVASNAAVDTMGCERLADQNASPRDRRFHTLVSLMLSSQTKDTVNAVVMAKLKKELPPYEEGAPPGLNLENMLAVEPALLNEFIWAVGFHNNKTKCVSLSLLLFRLDAVPGSGLLFCKTTNKSASHADISNKPPKSSATNGTATSPTPSKA